VPIQVHKIEQGKEGEPNLERQDCPVLLGGGKVAIPQDFRENEELQEHCSTNAAHA
jgi:hypothetical protein